MDCRTWESQLDDYLAGRLDPAQQRAAEDKETRSVMIGKVSYWRLDNKGQKAAYPCHQSDLCQCEGKLFDKHGEKRTDKRDVEIANKMNEEETKDYLHISCFWMFHRIHK